MSWVIEGDPRQSVDNKEIVVDIDCGEAAASDDLTLVLLDMVAVPATFSLMASEFVVAAGWLELVGWVPAAVSEECVFPPTLWRRFNNSVVRPYSANGAGSTHFRVNRSATEAKHFRAPSDTMGSSCCSRVLRLSTQFCMHGVLGSTLVQSLDTTDMAECKVSL